MLQKDQRFPEETQGELHATKVLDWRVPQQIRLNNISINVVVKIMSPSVLVLA